MSPGRKLLSLPALLTSVLLMADCSCMSPMDPAAQPEPPKNTQQKIEQIRREETRLAAEVESAARSQGARGIGGSGGTGSAPVLPPETPTGTITGRLEATAPDRIVIRDQDGVEYWFEADPNMRVSRNGQPAQLSELPRGTQVRASYTLAGQKKRLTEVQVLGPS